MMAAMAIGTPIGILAGTYLAEFVAVDGSLLRRASSTTFCCPHLRS
jgi:ABC-type phosphate transport system permease subunit